MISKRATEIFERAKKRANNYKRDSVGLLHSVDEIDRHLVYVEFKSPSPFKFCVKLLKLPHDVVYELINVMRATRRVPQLMIAIDQGLQVSKARRISPVITVENHEEWIHWARTLSKRALERKLADINPKFVERERVKASPRGRVKIEFYTSTPRLEALERAKDLVSASLGAPANWDETIAFATEHFLSLKDPVAKADRNVDRINASIKTRVFARDRGRCQMKLDGDRRCGSRRFLHVHHRRARFNGGVDHVDNLTTLCSACHRAWHRRYGDVPLYENIAFGPDG